MLVSHSRDRSEVSLSRPALSFSGPLLVTGATGFIGACLTRRLVKEGAEVHILTRQHSNKWRIHDIIHDVWEHHVDL
ncbi:hypothetical protein HKBW3S09_01742, partial [Candidatus Hakubella thermalkaliphila]